MSLLASLLLALPQGPALLVKNPSAATRNELVRVSLPLPPGAYTDLPFVKVAGAWAPTVPLVRWPDGSLAVVQVHPRLSVPAGTRRRFTVDLNPTGEPPAESAAWHLPVDLPLHTELIDPWGAKYVARLVPDAAAGPGGLLRRSPRVRVRRYRAVHRRGDDSVFFGVTAYVTTFVGERRAELTLVLTNGQHASDPVAGPARFRRFTLVVEDRRLRTRPRFIVGNGLRPPRLVDGQWHQDLLGPSDQLYLGDTTAKAWRFDVFHDVGASKEEREAARLAAAHPLRPMPEVEWVRSTGAFGAHGGPAPGVGETTIESVFTLYSIRGNVRRGPFSGFGDPKDAAKNGTPRNGPSALHNVLRFGSSALLNNAEGMVLQQTLRPTPGHAIRIPDVTKALRAGLSKRTMQRPHGFLAADYEHFSVDLLFDHYWLTGDALARDEIARIGRGLPAILAAVPFHTSRGEGWCMQAAVLIARATGDDAAVKLMHRRFVDSIEPSLGVAPAPYLIRQPPHPDAFDGKLAFDCPWQMAAFVHGAHAMWKQTGGARYVKAALRAGQLMAGSGWLQGEGPKYFVGAVADGQYAMAVGIGPLEGTALMEVSGFTLAEEMAGKESDQRLFRRRAETIFAPYEKADRNRSAMNPWFQLYLDRRARRR